MKGSPLIGGKKNQSKKGAFMASKCKECGRQSFSNLVCSNCGKVITASSIDISKLPEVKPMYHLPPSMRGTFDPQAPRYLDLVKHTWGIKE
jgi:uncharacterized OB-fold protein